MLIRKMLKRMRGEKDDHKLLSADILQHDKIEPKPLKEGSLDKKIIRDIESIHKKSLPSRKSIFYKQKKLIRYFEKAGYSKDFFANIHKLLFFISAGITATVLILLLLIFHSSFQVQYIIGVSILGITFGTAIVYFIILSGFYWYVDFRIYLRGKEIEKMLPEYLMLVSSNMRAGMLIDQALLYAARPKFGFLSKEISIVIKDVAAGKELSQALKDFSDKYDSIILRRTVMIIIEGIESGGKTANMINKIALNLSELALQRKEMSASVTTYAIFITFASVVAAPVLMALSGQILIVIKNLITTMVESGGEKASISFMSFTVPPLTSQDFMIFSIIMLTITSIFSGIILAVIQKGDVKRGFKYIPIFILISVGIYLLAVMIFEQLFSGMLAV